MNTKAIHFFIKLQLMYRKLQPFPQKIHSHVMQGILRQLNRLFQKTATALSNYVESLSKKVSVHIIHTIQGIATQSS